MRVLPGRRSGRARRDIALALALASCLSPTVGCDDASSDQATGSDLQTSPVPQPKPSAPDEATAPGPPAVAPAWGSLIERLSEPEQAFFSDNLVSNEASYLQAAPWLERLRPTAQAYVGVGPEQNLSYIALLRPKLAFVVDIRRDNLLLHLLYKRAFELADTRAEWLASMLSRVLPEDDPARAASETVAEVVQRVEAAPFSATAASTFVAGTLARMRGDWKLEPRADDEGRLIHLMRAFARAQLAARFESTSERPDFPTLRQLLTSRDPTGEPKSFLASAEAFRFLRALQLKGGIVPLTGDFAGTHTFAQLGRELARRNLKLSVLYASNVEQYLLLNGQWEQWQSNLSNLPHDEQSLLIRSYSDRKAPLPAQGSAAWLTLSQPLEELLATRAAPSSYRELALRSRSSLDSAAD